MKSQAVSAYVAALRKMIGASRRAVVFTGAGVSTESGIPDFRGPNGFWTRNRPIDFSEFMRSDEARRESWRRKIAAMREWGDARPNRGHRAIAELVRRGVVSHVITQNIDGLHQASGVPDDRTIELHGNTTYARCLQCRRRYELDEIVEPFERTGLAPQCGDCGGWVKTATISFGQPMPEEAMSLAEAATLECDLFLAMGSSLVVYPAAGFPILAKRNGARLAIVNRDPTDRDAEADLVIREGIGETLGEVVGVD
jgi:NAD-dependent deacetylase